MQLSHANQQIRDNVLIYLHSSFSLNTGKYNELSCQSRSVPAFSNMPQLPEIEFCHLFSRFGHQLKPENTFFNRLFSLPRKPKSSYNLP
jgi:hypothetical protein